MAKQTIGVGSVANDGTGDTLRAAFQKTNSNFDELYSTTATALQPATLPGGSIYEKDTAIAGAEIDVSLGGTFSKTIAANTTFTVANVPASGTTASFVLALTNGGAYTVTWWSGVKWAGGTPPTLTAAGVDILGFFTRDGGTIWRGFLLAADSK